MPSDTDGADTSTAAKDNGTAANAGGVIVTFITRNSPAEKQGLRVGDRILKFNQRPVDDQDRLGVAILSAESQLELTLLRSGKTEPETLTFKLDGKPVRVGVTWGEDQAEPGTIFLRQVVPLSPAGLAGLKIGDRVLEVSGRRFANSQEFGTLLNTLPGPLEMVIERRGRISTVRVPLADEWLAPNQAAPPTATTQSR
jgi:S1-C subfamily serine protease